MQEIYTKETLFQNEVRPVSISIVDEDLEKWIPDEAYAKVLDTTEAQNIVVPEASATIDSNKVSFTVGTTVTANPANYTLVWRVIQGSKIYYHKTDVKVIKL
jgi:hypothetical protein